MSVCLKDANAFFLYYRPVYFVTTPSVLRYNSMETVAVNVFGISDVSVQIYLQDYPNRTRTFSQTFVTASQGMTS